MDTAPAACCPAEIIRPPGRGRPLLPAAIHPAARCPGHVHGPGGLLPPGHVTRDPRRKQSGPNEIKTCRPFTGGDPRRPMPRPWTPAPPGRGRPCCLPRSPAAILDTSPRLPMRARVRGAACCLDTSPELSTVPAGDPSGGDPGHVPDGPGPRRRSPAACCRIATTARAAPLLPLPPSAIRATPRRAPGRAAPHHAPRHHAGATRPRMQPLRGCFYRATRNASALRIREPLRPCITRRVPPHAPPRPCARVAPLTRSPARVRAPAFACRYCARDFPLSRAL